MTKAMESTEKNVNTAIRIKYINKQKTMNLAERLGQFLGISRHIS